MNQPVAKADVNSADPGEPWRYVCPRCESTCVYPTPNGGYTCRGCRDPIDHVWDRKRESIAHP